MPKHFSNSSPFHLSIPIYVLCYLERVQIQNNDFKPKLAFFVFTSSPPNTINRSVCHHRTESAQTCGMLNDLGDHSFSHNKMRRKSISECRKLQGKLRTGPRTLAVNDLAVKDVRGICSNLVTHRSPES